METRDDRKPVGGSAQKCDSHGRGPTPDLLLLTAIDRIGTLCLAADAPLSAAAWASRNTDIGWLQCPNCDTRRRFVLPEWRLPTYDIHLHGPGRARVYHCFQRSIE